MNIVKVMSALEALALAKDNDAAVRCLDWDKRDFISYTKPATVNADNIWSTHNRQKAIENGGLIHVMGSYTRYHHSRGIEMGYTPSGSDLCGDWVEANTRLLPVKIRAYGGPVSVDYKLVNGDNPFKSIDEARASCKEIVFVTAVKDSYLHSLFELLVATTKDIINFNGTIETTVNTDVTLYEEHEHTVILPLNEQGLEHALSNYIANHPDCLEEDDILFVIDLDSVKSTPKVNNDYDVVELDLNKYLG